MTSVDATVGKWGLSHLPTDGDTRRIVDLTGVNGGNISSELNSLNLSDISEDSASQQMANDVYRLTGIAANGINP